MLPLTDCLAPFIVATSLVKKSGLGCIFQNAMKRKWSDLCLAIDSGHVEHGLAVVGQDKLIKPLVSGVLAVERLAREAESTISPDVSSGVRSPSLSQKSALMPQADAQ